MSHAALLDVVIQFDVIGSSDILICFSSLYWLSGWAVLLLGMLNGATRIITTKSYAPELQLRLVEQYKVTFAWNAPHQVIMMLKSAYLDQSNLSSLKFQLIIGGRTPFQAQTEFATKLPNGRVHICYGLSECAGIVTVNVSDKDAVGQLMNGCKVKIIDVDGNRCEIGKDGEICVQNNYRFLGYYGNQKATEEFIDEGGFLLTADIVHFDEDGNLYIVDRKKDIIKYCNYQISPSQLEAYLIESSNIKSACIVGIPDKIGVTDLPAAFVVRNDGSNISERDVFDMVAGKCFIDLNCKG